MEGGLSERRGRRGQGGTRWVIPEGRSHRGREKTWAGPRPIRGLSKGDLIGRPRTLCSSPRETKTNKCEHEILERNKKD